MKTFKNILHTSEPTGLSDEQIYPGYILKSQFVSGDAFTNNCKSLTRKWRVDVCPVWIAKCPGPHC